MSETQPGTFPVDEITLNVVRDALDRTYIDTDENGDPIVAPGSAFGLSRVLELMSGYDPEALVAGEYFGGQVFSVYDVVRALIGEVERLRRIVGEPFGGSG